ncbi:flavohemoglobin [Patellaria atrata CBS 101060]|uniref:nitric oxide dioxygenase n=1 Tax=Patellaria atrata CBS 101060 TaxID=1346257 RepID=A0A9P4VSA7_9PEZI|nr:flavohemoglobin [Patellaria atrata CBS 101060]
MATTPKLVEQPLPPTPNPKPGPLTPEQAKIIKSTVPVLAEHGVPITRNFYNNMLTAHPSLRRVFNHSSQANSHQPLALAAALYAYADNISDLGALGPAVAVICNKHASLDIQPAQYAIVGKYLLESMSTILGDAVTPEIHDAWAAAYWQLADIMIDAEAKLYGTAGKWKGWRDFRIARKVRESRDVTSFYLEPVDGEPLPSFHPGQYISVEMDVPALGYRQSRQYSLSDAPRREHFRISVKREDGVPDVQSPEAARHPAYVSNVLHDTKNEGDVVGVTHPFGEFFVDPTLETDAPLVLLGAGVGLTPLLSILNTLVERGTKRKISWIHTARNSEVRAFEQHVRGVGEKNDNVKTRILEGHLDLDRLDKEEDLFVEDNKTEYFICGPLAFMEGMKEKLQSYGAGADRIHLERFGVAS